MHWLELDNSIDSPDIPNKEFFDLWVATTLGGQDAELTIKIISKEQMIELNSQYRQKKQATDVLSFPYDEAHQQELNPRLPYLGDVAICPEVLQQDAEKLDCELQAHWAHIVIHSVLHLLGYDHKLPNDQQEMEQLESKIMQDLKFNDPWEINK